MSFSFFFFNDTATTEIYTLSLHDALPICSNDVSVVISSTFACLGSPPRPRAVADRNHARSSATHPTRPDQDRKSTRLNSSHANISYAVFCLKKKNTTSI